MIIKVCRKANKYFTTMKFSKIRHTRGWYKIFWNDGTHGYWPEEELIFFIELG